MASQVDKFEEMARVFHSLGNETRLRIMAVLAKGEMNGTALCKKLRLSETTVSHHLSLLRQGGMVVNRRDGWYIFYSLSDLSKHRLGRKAELAKRGSNAARFGPVELALPKT
jgi:ArsR family transcriptional regulator